MMMKDCIQDKLKIIAGEFTLTVNTQAPQQGDNKAPWHWYDFYPSINLWDIGIGTQSLVESQWFLAANTQELLSMQGGYIINADHDHATTPTSWLKEDTRKILYV